MRAYELISKRMLVELTDATKNKLKEKYRAQHPDVDDSVFDEYLSDWERFANSIPSEYKNITLLPFSTVKAIIDEILIRQELRGKGKGRFLNKKFEPPKPLVSKNNLDVFLCDTKEKAQYLSHDHNGSYTWCVGRKDASNLFNSYRFKKNATFYFVFDYDKSSTDVWHAVVIIIYPDRIDVATADNPGDKTMTWEEIVKHLPKLKKLQSLFNVDPVPDDFKFNKHPSNMSFVEQFHYIDLDNVVPSITLDKIDPLLFELYAKRQPAHASSHKRFSELKQGTQKYVNKQLISIIQTHLNETPVNLEEILNIVTSVNKTLSSIDHDVGTEAETSIADDPIASITYIGCFVKPWSQINPELSEYADRILATSDPHTAYEYAEILEQPWQNINPSLAKFAEQTIARNKDTAVKYAIGIHVKPWSSFCPQAAAIAESNIIKSGVSAASYAINFNKPWTTLNPALAKQAEAAISKQGMLAFQYAKMVGEPWSQFNPDIAKQAEDSMRRAMVHDSYRKVFGISNEN